jgi:predicted ATPase with chaperone activity
VRHVDGLLATTYVAKESGYKMVYVPKTDAPEAALVEGIDLYPVDTLARFLRDYGDIPGGGAPQPRRPRMVDLLLLHQRR